MGTVAEDILRRIEAIERDIGELQLNGPLPTGPVPPSESMRNMSEQFAQLRNRIQQLETSTPASGESRGVFGMSPNFGMSPKELLPDKLADHFKDKWRLWSYKARDYLSLWDESLGPKLEEIESMPTSLTDEYI